MNVTDRELLQAVLDNLAKNNQHLHVDGFEPKIGDEEWKRELREAQRAGIHRTRAEFRVIPFRRKGNGFGSIDEMTLAVSQKEFLSRGAEIIRKLFDEIP